MRKSRKKKKRGEKKEKVSYTIPFKNSYIYSILPRDKFLSCLTPRRN